MPITLPIATLIGSAIGGGTALAGMHSQGKANNQANALQSKYSDQALAAQREQDTYDRIRQNQQDAESKREYDQDYGLNRDQFGFTQAQADRAQANLENSRNYIRGQYGNYLTRLSPYSQAGASTVANLASVLGRNLPASIPTAGSGAMVRLQSPNGQIQEVPAEHADHYLSLGATKV